MKLLASRRARPQVALARAHQFHPPEVSAKGDLYEGTSLTSQKILSNSSIASWLA